MADPIDFGFKKPISHGTQESEPPRLIHGPNEFMHQYELKLRLIADSLEKWLEVPLLFEEYEKAPMLLLDITGPIFELGKKQIDSKRLIESVDDLDAAIGQLKSARRTLDALPRPIDELVLASSKAIDIEIEALGRARAWCKTMQGQSKGRANSRALRVAKILRAAFERYTRKPITCHQVDGTMTSEFCQALEEIYSLIGISANAFNFGRKARACPENDPELLELKEALRRQIDLESDNAIFFSEITRYYIDPSEWHHVNTNADAQDLEQMEMSQCKYLKMNVFTTMTTRSLISSHLGRNERNGGIAKLDLPGSSLGAE